MQRYTLAVTSPEYWSKIHKALIEDSNEDGIPDRKISCTDSKNHSPTRGTYELTDEEAEQISKHPHVKWIELSISDYPNIYPKPEPDTKRFRKNVKVYRDLSLNYPPATPTSAEENRTNWATKRVGIATNGDSWPNVTGNPGVINTDLSFSLTGKNVDLIIQDSGCLQYHPEFIDDDGKSRVRDVILDGPYYIDPTYFNNNGYTYTKPDGRTGITTTSAHSWWENSGSRSAAFSSLGTVSIPNNYTVANALGIGGTSHTMTSSHGTACASLSGGKNFGLAFESNLWTISIFSPANINTDSSYDAIKILHQYKPINTATGRKNPTVVNGSWGYFGGFNSGTTVNYSFKGSTGSFTGYSSSSTGVQALAYGLKQGQYYQRQYATSSANNSVDTAGDEMVEAGVIFVTSAGNSNQRLGIGNTDPHINDYLTSLNGGDSRTGFPSASQSGTKPVGHVKWLHPQRNGYDSVNDIYSSIIVGAMDEYVNSDYTERKASYSNNGPGIDLYAPADETLAAGMRAANGDQLGTETNYARYNSDFVDRYFNGTSAAAPVVAGLVALFLESKPDATSAEVKDYIKTHGSKVVPSMWEDTTPDDTDANYWRGDFNNRGAESRILFDPTASDMRPAFNNIIGGESIITDNLVLNLDANNYTSGTTWTDTSGQSNNGTINGSTYNSENGGYFDFDGTNDYVSLGTSINSHISVHKDCSFNIWMQFDIDSRDNVIITHPTIGSGNDRFLIWYDKSAFGTPNNTGGNDVGGGTTNIITVHVKNSGGGEYRWTTSNNVFGNNTTNTWHNICVVLDTTNDKYYTYLNGQQVALYNSTSVQGIDSNTGGVGQDFYIGRSNNSHNSWLDGKISQFLVYSKALSPLEVEHNFDAMKGRFEQRPLILSRSFGGENIITSDLVLNLDANNYTSGTTWTDLSSSSNNATLTNGVTYSSDNGGVLVFDGTDDYVVTGSDMFNANANFTFSMWFNSDDFSVQRAFAADVNNSQSLFLRYNSGIQVVNSNTAVLGSFSSSTLSTNTWYNITFTRSSNTYTFYLNGSSVSTVNTSQSFTHSPTTIGANNNNSPPPVYKNAFDGKISKVLAYSTALSDSDVKHNFDTMKGRYLDNPLILSGISYSLT